MLLQKGVQFVCGLNGECAALKGKDGSARLAACDADAQHVVLTGMRQPQQQEFN